MGVENPKKINNPSIFKIIRLYIANMNSLKEPEGCRNVNQVLALIGEKEGQIFNLQIKMKEAGILEDYNSVCNKENYIQLNKIEKLISYALQTFFMGHITDNNEILNIEKFKKNFAVFAQEDTEINQLCRSIAEIGRHSDEKRGIMRTNRGGIGTEEQNYKVQLYKLIEKMADRVLENFESYEEYIYASNVPIDLNLVYVNLHSYFQDRISSMQGFYIEHVPTTPTRS